MLVGVVLIAQGNGNSKAISRSNSKNRIATRKKRREKGSRAVPRGSKPHSYGESFSVSGLVCGNQKLMVIRIIASIVISINVDIIIILSHGVLRLSDWKSLVQYTKRI